MSKERFDIEDEYEAVDWTQLVEKDPGAVKHTDDERTNYKADLTTVRTDGVGCVGVCGRRVQGYGCLRACRR